MAGMARGRGRISFPAGGKMVSYEGGVEDAVPSGAGVLVTKDGRLEATFAQGAAQGDGVFVPAHGTAPIRGTWLYGAYQWPAVDKIAFVGGIDGEGRRHGMGWCRTSGSPLADPCRYKNDRQIALDTQDD
jgi:hypothetical protein